MDTMEAHAADAARYPGSGGTSVPTGERGAVQIFSSNERIYDEGARARFLYRVVSGAARSVKTLSNGRRLVCGFHFAGDVFGLEYAPAHSETAEAVSECEVEVIARSQLQAMDRGGSELWRLTCEALKRAQSQMLLLGRKSADERVASFVLDLLGRNAGGIDIDLAMNRFDIADHLGLTMETVSRILSRFERDGLIAIGSPRQIRVLDAERLKRAGE